MEATKSWGLTKGDEQHKTVLQYLRNHKLSISHLRLKCYNQNAFKISQNSKPFFFSFLVVGVTLVTHQILSIKFLLEKTVISSM